MPDPTKLPINKTGQPYTTPRRDPGAEADDEFSRYLKAVQAIAANYVQGSDATNLSTGTPLEARTSTAPTSEPSFPGTPGYGPSERAAAQNFNDQRNYANKVAGMIDAKPRREYALDGTDITGAPKDRMGTTITPGTDFSKALAFSKPGEGGLADRLRATRTDGQAVYNSIGAQMGAQPLSPASRAVVDAKDRQALNDALRIPMDRQDVYGFHPGGSYVTPRTATPPPVVTPPPVPNPVAQSPTSAPRTPAPAFTPFLPATVRVPQANLTLQNSPNPVALPQYTPPGFVAPPTAVALDSLPTDNVQRVSSRFGFQGSAPVEPTTDPNEPTINRVTPVGSSFNFSNKVGISGKYTLDDLLDAAGR